MQLSSFRVLPGTVLVLAVVCFARVAAAQPSDATVRRDLREPGQVSITFPGDGNRPEQIHPGEWEFLRSAEIVQHSDEPGIDIRLIGLARYASTNGRSWHFVDFLTSESHYLGIPDPGAAEIDALIRAHPATFFAGMAPQVLGLPTAGPTLASDATFDWHTLNSVSFPMVGCSWSHARASAPKTNKSMRRMLPFADFAAARARAVAPSVPLALGCLSHTVVGEDVSRDPPRVFVGDRTALVPGVGGSRIVSLSYATWAPASQWRTAARPRALLSADRARTPRSRRRRA